MQTKNDQIELMGIVFRTFSLVKYLAKNDSSDEATVLTLSN
jgi:hypothetical protein